MDKSNPPTTWGVFKPTHHTLMAFKTQEGLNAARQALAGLGFTAEDIVEYSAAEMLAQCNEELQTHNAVANFGYELDLLRVHKEIAEDGCPFLVVHVPEEEDADRVAALVPQLKPVTAQHYGRILIRDLTEKPLAC